MSEKKEIKTLGRPMKGKDRRFQVGVYLPGSIVDTIDEYVVEQQKETPGQFSRSDFINEAVIKHMTDLGLIEGDKDEQE